MSDFSGGVQLKRGDGATPTEVFTLVPGVLVQPVLGQTNELIEVSDYDSTDKEYIAAYLSDGNEVDIEFNYNLGETQQVGVVDDIKGKINRNYEMTVTDGTQTLTSSFTLTPLGWNRTPSFSEQHKLSARFKISGAIVDVLV